MTHKYYLLENVKKPQELGVDFATYVGERQRTSQSLSLENAIFDSGTFQLCEMKQDKRQGHTYQHVIIYGDNSTFKLFEQYVESEGAQIRGAKYVEDGNRIQELIKTYLPANPRRMGPKIVGSIIAAASLIIAPLPLILNYYTQSDKNHQRNLELNPQVNFTILDYSKDSQALYETFELIQKNNPNLKISSSHTILENYSYGSANILVSGNYQDVVPLYKTYKSLRRFNVGDLEIMEEVKRKQDDR
jgi:hypothetical protein